MSDYPKCDCFIDESGKNYVMVFAVPGCKPEDLKISYEKIVKDVHRKINYHKITISGKMNDKFRYFNHPAYSKADANNDGYQLMFPKELKHSHFTRDFLFHSSVFDDIDAEKFSPSCSLVDGILTLSMPLGQIYQLKNINEFNRSKNLIEIRPNYSA